jgi:FAD/FMN-containing dehydrogenase
VSKSAERATINQFTYAAHAIETPSSLPEIRALMNRAVKEHRTISLVGANKSMGGQTTSDTGGYRLSLEKYNKLLALDIQKEEVTVQAGMTWRELQALIAPHGLAIRAMQSYHDFALGGSLSVNVHGQDIHDAPLIKTVISFRILCADGAIYNVSRSEHTELFGLAIGGYGLFGIILDVTLNLTVDTMLDRHVLAIDADLLADYVVHKMLPNDRISFFSARYALGKDKLLDKALMIYYTNNGLASTEKFKGLALHQSLFARAFLALTKLSGLVKSWRFFFEEQYLNAPRTISRNNFLNISISSLPQFSTYILQEYFIPYDKLNAFVKEMKAVFIKYRVNIINVSARHVPADTEAMLSYAPQDCCALVLYINIPKSDKGYVACARWTNELINAALRCNGTYYLPYHILATDAQILQAYPKLPTFLRLKKQYDPSELFSNRLYERYKHLAD